MGPQMNREVPPARDRITVLSKSLTRQRDTPVRDRRVRTTPPGSPIIPLIYPVEAMYVQTQVGSSGRRSVGFGERTRRGPQQVSISFMTCSPLNGEIERGWSWSPPITLGGTLESNVGETGSGSLRSCRGGHRLTSLARKVPECSIPEFAIAAASPHLGEMIMGNHRLLQRPRHRG